MYQLNLLIKVFFDNSAFRTKRTYSNYIRVFNTSSNNSHFFKLKQIKSFPYQYDK